jgi:ESF2/ABP1 family protein
MSSEEDESMRGEDVESGEEADLQDGDSGADGGSADEAGGSVGGSEGGDRPSGTRKRKRGLVGPSELTPEALAAFAAVERKKGVVYLARVPPFMKPIKVRHLLERYGEIGRVYLAPEDPSAYRRRVQSGGNKKVSYTEGWVEFLDKQVARATASLLNNTPVDGGKRGFHASDLWNIKYLKHFKWHHLTEKISYEKKVRALALRTELVAARKEAERYVGAAEKAKAIREAEERKAKRKGGPAAASSSSSSSDGAPAGAGAGSGAAADSGERDALNQIRRKFKQKEAIHDKSLEALGVVSAKKKART